MIQGIDCGDGKIASQVCTTAFHRGLVVETSGSDNQVIKCLSPLTISTPELEKGLDILRGSLKSVLHGATAQPQELAGVGT